MRLGLRTAGALLLLGTCNVPLLGCSGSNAATNQGANGGGAASVTAPGSGGSMVFPTGGTVGSGGSTGPTSTGGGGEGTSTIGNGGATGGGPSGNGGTAPAMSGSGGTLATGGTTNGGAGGTGGMTTASPCSATTGMQADPTTDGDGIEAQPGPYPLHDESTMHLNGAPTGQVLGPTIYTQTGTYDGWDQWKFTYWVYVPAQYVQGKPAAIMIFSDGLKFKGDDAVLPGWNFYSPTVLDNLIAEGSMPVTIGVFIDPGSNDGHHVGGGDGGRSRQYDSANDQYGKFLFNEFLPSEITSKYTIVTDPDGWGTTGHSSSGNAAFSLGWFYTDKIHKILTASASMGLTGGFFPAHLLDTPVKPLRIYHMSGSGDGETFGPNNTAADNLMTMGYHFRYRPGTDVHSPPAAAASDYPDALRWLWRGYKLPCYP